MRKYLVDSYKPKLERGVRTMKELAHYVRCIPLMEEDFCQEWVWSPPDVMRTARVGQEADHAILMACLFTGV
jgi:hypothetical protein